jgi:hypothetical protein
LRLVKMGVKANSRRSGNEHSEHVSGEQVDNTAEMFGCNWLRFEDFEKHLLSVQR